METAIRCNYFFITSRPVARLFFRIVRGSSVHEKQRHEKSAPGLCFQGSRERTSEVAPAGSAFFLLWDAMHAFSPFRPSPLPSSPDAFDFWSSTCRGTKPTKEVSLPHTARAAVPRSENDHFLLGRPPYKGRNAWKRIEKETYAADCILGLAT